MLGLFYFNIKKTKIREFILTCVEMANCKEDGEIELILESADEKGLFFGDEKMSIQGAIGDGVGFYRPLVYALCEMLRDGAPFTVDFRKGNRLIYKVNKNQCGRVLEFDRGTVVFSSETRTIPLPETLLFEAFFGALQQYSQEKNTTLFKIPLGICLECDDIFLGRLPGQKFCSTEHGQRWRAREAYRKKKGEDMPS